MNHFAQLLPQKVALGTHRNLGGQISCRNFFRCACLLPDAGNHLAKGVHQGAYFIRGSSFHIYVYIALGQPVGYLYQAANRPDGPGYKSYQNDGYENTRNHCRYSTIFEDIGRCLCNFLNRSRGANPPLGVADGDWADDITAFKVFQR
ncbi:hypothetical protein SDC9_160933 [bioreactor metagenome]|uniref:Uncharacterized protein n=1 Tax=bioreactor metagenome TaxID=1076179 RepID=A0A645FGV9_9ZZZZ